jgi:TP901 family phage tail tape measure protein
MNLDLGSLVAHIRLEQSGFEKGARTVTKSLDNLSRKMRQTGVQMSLYIGTPLTLLGRKMVKDFAKFNEAIIKSMSVMGASTKAVQMQLEDVATALSTKVATSAAELARGYFELGQAGFTAAKAMEALPIVEKFAYAGSMHLSQATSYLTKTQRALGLELKDPVANMAEMERVADNLTYAAIQSTAEMVDFAEAMKNAGPALRILNKDMEEGVAVLMAMANQGHVGSEAGTQLYMVYRDLQRANIKNKKMWEDQGLSVYDVNGKMLNLADILLQLENKFANMSDEGVRTTLMMLGFQDRSLRATQAVMGMSEKIRAFEQELKDVGGQTEWVAKKMRESFIAQLNVLSNKLGIISRSIGKILADQLIRLGRIVDHLTTLWTKMTPETQKFIVHVGEMLVVLGPTLIALAGMIKMTSIFTSALRALFSPLTIIIVAMGLIGRSTDYLTGAKNFDWFIGKVGKGYTGLADTIKKVHNRIKNWTKEDTEMISLYFDIWVIKIEKLIAQLGAFLSYLKRNFSGAFDQVFHLIELSFVSFGTVMISLAFDIGSAMAAAFKKSILSVFTSNKMEKEARRLYKEWHEKSLADVFNTQRSSMPQSAFIGLPASENLGGYDALLSGMGIDTKQQPSMPEKLQEFRQQVLSANRAKITGAYEARATDYMSKGFESIAEAFRNSWRDFATGDPQLIKGFARADVIADKKIFMAQFRQGMRFLKRDVGKVLSPYAPAWDAILEVTKKERKALQFTVDTLKAVWKGVELPKPVGEDAKKRDGTEQALFVDERYRMSAEEILNIIEKLYGGLDQHSEDYFDLQRQHLADNVKRWEANAELIAVMHDMKLQKVYELIAAYEEAQEKLIAWEEAIAGRDFFAGMQTSFQQTFENLGELGKLGHSVGNVISEGLGQSMVDFANGTKDATEAMRDLAREVANVALKWATMKLVTGALDALSGGVGGMFSSFFGGEESGISASQQQFDYQTGGFHTGGIVGSEGETRFVPSSVFSNAIKAHKGLMPNERPIIATKGEGVFTPGQMKALGGRSEQSEKTEHLLEDILAQLIRRQTVNAVVVDSREVVTKQMMEGRDGESLVMNHVTRNNPNE